jgi:hypothetical protein
MDYAQEYEQIIRWIVLRCPAPDKFAHTYAGLTIWLLSAALFRQPLRSVWPLVTVIGFEIANECVDRVAHGSWMWYDTLGDAAATWFWPLLLMIMLQRIPRLRQ